MLIILLLTLYTWTPFEAQGTENMLERGYLVFSFSSFES